MVGREPQEFRISNFEIFIRAAASAQLLCDFASFMTSITATQQRELAGQLAGTDPTRALTVARQIEDPWFACQALAWVARYAPDQQFIKITKESLHVCSNEIDPYRIVAPAAWPVRAIVERSHSQLLPSIIPNLLRRAKDIENMGSRSEAIFILFQAIFPAGRHNWFPVLQSLREASIPLINWRQRRNLCEAVLIVSSEDQKLATEITNGLSDPKLKNKIEKQLATAKAHPPRPFFWTTAA
jgi:hypothetical protein